MRQLNRSTVYRGELLARAVTEQKHPVTASSSGGSLSVNTSIPWGSGSSEVTFGIPPADFRDLLFEMILANPAAVHRAYASLADVMLSNLVLQVGRSET